MEETMTTWREEEEGEKGKVKEFPFSKQVGFVLERKNKFLSEGNKEILNCLKKKLNGYSLEEQYPFMEKEQKLEI